MIAVGVRATRTRTEGQRIMANTRTVHVSSVDLRPDNVELVVSRPYDDLPEIPGIMLDLPGCNPIMLGMVAARDLGAMLTATYDAWHAGFMASIR